MTTLCEAKPNPRRQRKAAPAHRAATSTSHAKTAATAGRKAAKKTSSASRRTATTTAKQSKKDAAAARAAAREAAAKAAARKDALLRAQSLAEQVIEYIDHPSFAHPEHPDALPLAAVPDFDELIEAPRGLPAYLTSLYEVPLLSKESEETYFAKMNYLKYRADHLRRELNLKRPSIPKLNEIERLLAEATNLRNRIVQANLRLVVAIAKKFVDRSNSLEDLVSEGHLPLMRAVELFDFSRGFRFSTYATWAIRNHFVRATTDKRKFQNRYSTSDPFIFERASEKRPAVNESEGKLNHRKQVVEEFLSRLQPREQSILSARYGLADHGHPQTLSEIGRDLGISKERVRQLSLRALGKLQEIAAEETVELPDEMG